MYLQSLVGQQLGVDPDAAVDLDDDDEGAGEGEAGEEAEAEVRLGWSACMLTAWTLPSTSRPWRSAAAASALALAVHQMQ